MSPVPLVFVPGFMGSDLFETDARGNFVRRIWPPVSYTPQGVAEFTGLDPLVDLPPDRKLASADALLLGVYGGLLRRLYNLGYRTGESFWVYAYDWTQSNAQSGRGLAEFINKLLAEHPSWRSVDVVSHSMGGIVTRAAIVFHKAPVRKAVYLATPHYGAPRAYFTLHPAAKTDLLGGWIDQAAQFLWRWTLKMRAELGLKQKLKSIAQKVDSVYELLPDHHYLTPEYSMVTVRNGTRRYQVTGVDATYYTDACRFPPSMQERVRQAMDFKDRLGQNVPGSHLLVYTGSVVTPDHVVYDVGPLARGFRTPRDSGNHGDDTVPTRSASVDSPDATRVEKATHNTLPNNRQAQDLLAAFLSR